MGVESKSAVLSDLLKIVEIAANTDSPVLIAGEGAVEKEFFARMLHFDGARREKPFVRLDCAGSFDSLANLQNELAACLKKAGGGTLFIDELASLSVESQRHLLHCIHQKTLNVRIVGASLRNLGELVLQGKFIEELLSAMSGVVLRVPSIQGRIGDTQADLEKLGQSELAALFKGDKKKCLKEAETIFKKSYVKSVLQGTNYNQTKAAEILGIQRTYLSRLLGELGIRK